MQEFAIEAPARAAAFVAQLAHESGQFRFMEEIWGPTPAQLRYEPQTPLAKDLGNTDAGDGRRFKGRGPIQITGRANYRRFGDTLGFDLVADPPRAAQPDLAFRIAALFWTKKGLNELADRADADAFREITRRINGGVNGLDERRKFYATARTVLGVAEGTVTGVTRDRGAPAAADEPDFTRGAEAIRSHRRRPPVRKTVAGAQAKPTTVRSRSRKKKAPAKNTATSRVTVRSSNTKVQSRPRTRTRKAGGGKRRTAAAKGGRKK
jgi:predicted chitinase